MKPRDIMMFIVGALVMLGFFGALGAIFQFEIPASNRDLAIALIGMLASKFGDVVSYNFNTTKGSADKTEIISKLPPVAVLLVGLLLLSGCSSNKPLVSEVPIQYKERIVERLVPVTIPADSSALFALFECDSDKQVILKQLREMKGKAESNIDFQAGKLTYKLIYKHDTVYVKSDSVFIDKEVPFRVEVPVKVNVLTQWQIFQIWLGRILLAAAGLILIKMLLKRYLNFKI